MCVFLISTLPSILTLKLTSNSQKLQALSRYVSYSLFHEEDMPQRPRNYLFTSVLCFAYHQVEEFGMHLHVDGTVLYGLKVEAIDDKRGDNISIDKLSRMLVDIHQDSTKIMGDMLTPYQRDLMDIVFMGDTENRGKVRSIDTSAEGKVVLSAHILSSHAPLSAACSTM